MQQTDKTLFKTYGKFLRYNYYEIIKKDLNLILFDDIDLEERMKSEFPSYCTNKVEHEVVSHGYDNIMMMGSFTSDGNAIKIWMISHVSHCPKDFKEYYNTYFYKK